MYSRIEASEQTMNDVMQDIVKQQRLIVILNVFKFKSKIVKLLGIAIAIDTTVPVGRCALPFIYRALKARLIVHTKFVVRCLYLNK